MSPADPDLEALLSLTGPGADLTDEGLASLWAQASMLDRADSPRMSVDWANLPDFDPTDAVWAGIQRQAWLDLAPPKMLPWRHSARDKQLPPPGRWRHWLIMAGRGWGKALPVSQLLPVPYTDGVLPNDTKIPGPGWKRLGDIEIGDQVFDESGRPCSVTAIYEPEVTKAYRLTFSDGVTIDACADHQWVTWTHVERKAYLRSQHEDDVTRFPDEWPEWRAKRLPTRTLDRVAVARSLELKAQGVSLGKAADAVGLSRGPLAEHWNAGHYIEPVAKAGPSATGPQIRTTQQIVDTLTHGKRGDTNHCIPLAGPLQLPERDDLDIDPWLLGYWLGNGGTGTGAVHGDKRDLPEVDAAMARAGYLPSDDTSRDDQGGFTVYVRGLVTALRAAGVLSAKRVPHRYLWSSIDQREALLRGLMDSDGFCDKDSGKVEFTSTTENLADAVVHLARSLGQKPIKAEGRAMLDGVDRGPKWRVTWRPTRNPFSLSRKAERVREEGAQSLRNHHRMIVAAEEIPPVRMRCLTVDSPHHMFLAGEAMIPTHNTFVGANWLAERALTDPGDYAVIAPTLGDAKKICVEGESGLLAALGGEDGPNITSYNRSEYVITLVNGSRIILGSADAPQRIRGLNLRGVWCDEVGSWRDITVWNEGIKFATRKGDPRIVITTTPTRGNKILVKLLDDHTGKGGSILGGQAGNTFLTRGSTRENQRNLSSEWLNEIEEEFAGTTLGRQELDGELLRAIPGALITLDIIEHTRLLAVQAPEFDRIVVAVDPSVTDTEDSDECGIMVAGIGPAPLDWQPPPGVPVSLEGAKHLYWLEDYSLKGTPEAWGRRALQAAEEWRADAIAAEVNQGGDLVSTMLQMISRNEGSKLPHIHQVRASVGKRTRAEPVGGVWEQHRAHVVGRLKVFEDQWQSWVPTKSKGSPDRLDAGVWSAVELMPQLGVKSGTPIRTAGQAR
jgi:phage terminase large subunit-like protein